MLLGTPHPESGSRYPFDEKSAWVSDIPFSGDDVSALSLDGGVPCNLFSDVIIDCDADSFSIVLSDFIPDPPRMVFSWSADGVSGSFLLSSNMFGHGDTAMFVLPHAIIRLRSSLGQKLWAIVSRFADLLADIHTDINNVIQHNQQHPDELVDIPRLPGPISFDPHCYRMSERRLLSLSANGKSVAGDIKFVPGYNSNVSEYEFDSELNALSIDLSPGSGLGPAPCPESDQESGGMAGLIPESDGSARIEVDDCYSVIPYNNDLLKIYGHCSACCTCEGDYLPLAIAVSRLITDTVEEYRRLDMLRSKYNNFAQSCKLSADSVERLRISAAATCYLKSASANFAVSATISSIFQAQITITNIRFVIRATGMTYRTVSVDMSRFPFSTQSVLENRRTLRTMKSTLTGREALISGEGLTLQPGESFDLVSELTADNKKDPGVVVMNSNTVDIMITYKTYNPDLTQDEHLRSKQVKVSRQTLS